MESHSRGMESSQFVITAWHITTILQRQDYQTPMVLKIKATRASIKALQGYEYVGDACLVVDESHIHITTWTAREGTNPVFPTIMWGQVYLSGYDLAGLRLEVFPALTRMFCAKPNWKLHTPTTNPPVLCLWVLSIFGKLGYAWVQKF